MSLKLDIDNPEIEIPIALQMIANKNVSSLIDEFFFELHFQCEFLMYCGWGTNIPDSIHSFHLSRLSVMTFFWTSEGEV